MDIFEKLPQDVKELAFAISKVSEASYCATWLISIEYRVWEVVKHGKSSNNRLSISELEIERIKSLSVNLEQWIVLVEGIGLLPIPIQDWINHFDQPKKNPINVGQYANHTVPFNPLSYYGVVLPEEVDITIKQKLLFFDKIIVAGFPELFSPEMDTVKYVKENSFTYSYANGLQPYKPTKNIWLNDQELFSAFEISRLNVSQSSDEEHLLKVLLNSKTQLSKSILRRLAAAQLKRVYSMDAISCESEHESILSFNSDKKTSIINLSIFKLGLPDENISFERIKDFKNEEDNKRGLLSLRTLISDLSKAQISYKEFAEKLEWLLMEHEKALRLHDFKHKQGVLETFIVTPLEIVEELMPFKLSGIVKTFFAIKNAKISLLQSEMSSPGYQIAYILRTLNKFEKRN